MQFKIYFPLLFLTLFCSVTILGQSSKRQVLEARRTQIQKDIIYINALLSNTKRKESNLLSEVKDLKDKIKTREELISEIKTKKSFLCVGLDPDIDKIPKSKINPIYFTLVFNYQLWFYKVSLYSY